MTFSVMIAVLFGQGDGLWAAALPKAEATADRPTFSNGDYRPE
jgi:hypothetical protein